MFSARPITRTTATGYLKVNNNTSSSHFFSLPCSSIVRGFSGQTAGTNGSFVAPTSAKKKKKKTPLSALPNTAILRSLLIATVTSKPYLLTPSLNVLSWLSERPVTSLWHVDRNPILRFILKNTFYKQFCAGESLSETRKTIENFKTLGFQGTIITYAKETVFDYNKNKAQWHGEGLKAMDPDRCENIVAWRKGALETADMLGAGDILALKLTGAGPRVTDAFAAGQLPPPSMMEALHEVCARCKERDARVIVDAESQKFQDAIFLVGMELMRAYNREGSAMVYNTYQAYLKSTPDTISKHLKLCADENLTFGLKVVRGAYLATEKRSLMHDTKQDTDRAYDAIAQGALRQEMGGFGRPGSSSLPFPPVDLLLASHNRESLLAAHRTHQSRARLGLPTVPLVMAQLQGMSDELSFELIQMRGDEPLVPEIYKCSTWGTLSDCLAYLTRRAAENRDSVARTVDEYRALKREARKRLGVSWLFG